MKDFLCPKKSSLKDDSNGTKNETDKRILWFFMIGQSFVKSIGVFPGPWSTFLKTHPVVKGLIEEPSLCEDNYTFLFLSDRM